MNTFTELKSLLRDLGYVHVDLETSDQDRYGFVLTGLRHPDRPVLQAELDAVSDLLLNRNLLDLDWDGLVGEDQYGYARINLKETP